MPMSDLRENFGWLVGSIATAIAMAFGWLISSEAVISLLFLLIGSGITYFVQSRTQKRAWKREYAVKIAETVYGSLFREVQNGIRSLERKSYWHLSFREWWEMKKDHRYFMVEEKFRAKLDEFLERVENYGRAVGELRNTVLPEILNEETERVFDVETEKTANLEVKYKEKHRNVSASTNTMECLISETHPKDRALRNLSGISNVECLVDIRLRDGKTFHSHDLEKFNEFWQSCLRRMKEDETYKFVIEENEKLLEEARNVKKEIVKRIEEPWKT